HFAVPALNPLLVQIANRAGAVFLFDVVMESATRVVGCVRILCRQELDIGIDRIFEGKRAGRGTKETASFGNVESPRGRLRLCKVEHRTAVSIWKIVGDAR